jgi:hypothetical protein
MEPQVFTILGIDVIITPVEEKQRFRENTVRFEIQYDKDDLALEGISEDALKAKIHTFMNET